MTRPRKRPQTKPAKKGLAAELANAQSWSKAAAERAESARTEFKRSRKAYRSARKIAKEARKEVKALKKRLKASVARSRRRLTKTSRPPTTKAKASGAGTTKPKAAAGVRTRWKGVRAPGPEEQRSAMERESRAAQPKTGEPIHSGAPFPEYPVRVETPPPATP